MPARPPHVNNAVLHAARDVYNRIALERRAALRRIADLLEERGDTEALRALLGLSEDVETRTAQAQTTAEVLRALLASEKTYRLVFSHELDAMSLYDPRTGEILDVNAAWLKLYGYSREEALRLKVTDLSAEPSRTKEAIANALESGISRIDVRWHRSKNGDVFPVELTCGLLELGERQAMYAVMRDVSERHAAECALARSEASFRALIESMPDGVIVHRDGRIVYMSPSGRRMLGYSPDEDVSGLGILDVVEPDERGRAAERIAAITATGSATSPAEMRFSRKDGTSLVVEIAGHRTVFDGEPAVLAIARDVTARKQIEAQLVLADRLASLGRLSASIGHELNNPLAYVLGIITLAERDLAMASGLPPAFASRLSAHLGVLTEGTKRMRDIVDGLKTLGRDDEGVKVAVDIGHVLDVCCNMGEHELRPRGRLVKEYGHGLHVIGAEARLGQVFLNLLVNAAQALPEGNLEGNEVRVSARIEGDSVVVEVADTGVGIAREDAERIFEPFFTTKSGAGMGLGLSISYQIVTGAGGTIAARARPGGGTVFRVELPAARRPTSS